MEVNASQRKSLPKTFANGYSIWIDDCNGWRAVTIRQYRSQNG